MNNTSSNENIRNGNHSRVDVDRSVDNGDRDTLSIDSLEGSVCQQAAVSDGALNHVVSQDAAERLGAEIGKSGSDGLESGVGRGEDGNIAKAIDGFNQISSGKSACKRCEVKSTGSVGCRLRNSQDAVNDVDDTTSEVDVL